VNMSDIKVQPSPRGIIFDRFGKPLTSNIPSNKVFLLPRDLPENPDERIRTVKNVSAILNLPWEDVKKTIEEKDWGQSDRMIISSDINHDTLMELTALDIRGIYIEPSFKRTYEFPLELSHVLGYTGLVNSDDMENDSDLAIDDEIGRLGLEAYYDGYLRGTNGEEVFYRNSRGRIEDQRAVQKAVSGMSLQTNIDADLQIFMYERLMSALSELGRSVGVAIALNPQNGEVLGLVNIPGFDADNITSFLEAPNDPLFSRAISGLYNPGSTIKPLVGLAALSEGVVTTQTKIFSKGYIELPNPYNPSEPSRFLDWRPNGWVDIYDALAKSSNIYFYEVAGGFENQKGIGIDALKSWWKKFLFADKTGIDLTGERGGFLPDPDWKKSLRGEPWRVGDTYNVAIGQGDFLVTPIGLLNYISAIANGGKFYKPRVARSVVDSEGKEIFVNTQEVISDISDDIKEHLSDIRTGMRNVVAKSYGTARSLSDLPFAVAAKTGTAQIQNNMKTNAFFVGYAPYENPNIAILVLVENSKEGSLNTIPVAKDIFMWYYQNRSEN